MNIWWRFWHIYRWLMIARIAGAIGDRLERGHDRLHSQPDPKCKTCTGEHPRRFE